MTRTDRNNIFTWACLAALILFTPRVCAQTAAQSAAEAAQTRKTFVEYGKKYIGCPYVSGATGPASFDCSGFVYAVARESIGYQLPRTVKNIYKFCKIIDDSSREAGDLVFFKTTASDEASHVGIYIGNNQFLNCASDGPNTGVIVSSLKESYWKGKYYKTGRFLSASKIVEVNEENPASKASGAPKVPQKSTSSSTSQVKKTSSSYSSKNSSPFLSKVVLDGMFAIDWNFFTPDYVRLVFRGLAGTVHATYQGKTIQPGIGSIMRWDSGTGVLELPLIFSLTMTDYLRIYAGPVFTIGTPYLPGKGEDKIESSIFPGILGIAFNTPSVKAGNADVSFSQDIHYTVFNDTDGGALSPLKTITTGLVFSSGVRVTLPLSSLIK